MWVCNATTAFEMNSLTKEKNNWTVSVISYLSKKDKALNSCILCLFYLCGEMIKLIPTIWVCAKFWRTKNQKKILNVKYLKIFESRKCVHDRHTILLFKKKKTFESLFLYLVPHKPFENDKILCFSLCISVSILRIFLVFFFRLIY